VANVHKSSAASRKNKSSSKKPPKKESKKNLAVHFGHENFNLVLNMMIGIQMSVRTEFAAEDLIINPRDFSLKYYFELVPKRTGQDKKETFKICKFHDYAPQVSIRCNAGV
jgi:1-phosphatidylinositol-4-phosphate 5-kinase